MKCCETKGKSTINCKMCKGVAQLVEIFVLKHQLKPEIKLKLPDKKYYYCKTPTCEIVYFSEDGLAFTKKDIRIKIRIKEKEQEGLLVCYCFGFTERQIIDDFHRNGVSKITEWIKNEVKDKHCACEYKNPSGRCCLGDIAEVLKRRQKNHE